MLFSIVWIALNVPESPMFLYEKRDFINLRESFTQIALVNQIKEPAETVNYIMKKLKNQAIKDD
jgi:hypothetical protein